MMLRAGHRTEQALVDVSSPLQREGLSSRMIPFSRLPGTLRQPRLCLAPATALRTPLSSSVNVCRLPQRRVVQTSLKSTNMETHVNSCMYAAMLPTLQPSTSTQTYIYSTLPVLGGLCTRLPMTGPDNPHTKILEPPTLSFP